MASFWEQFISIFKGTTKKKKKKDTPRRRSFVSEKAKKETHKPAKRSAPTPSRKGRQANPEVVKRGQALGTQAVKQHKQYEAYRAKKKAQQNKKDMQILQRTTGQKYKHNQEIKPAVYTGNPEDYAKYRVNAKVIDKTKDKTVYDKKTGTSKGVTLKEYYSAPEHQKEAQKQMAQDEKFINEHPFLAGFGSSYSKFANRGVEDLKDIYSNVKRKDGGKGINTKKYDKSTAAKVGEMAGTASQYLITGGAAGGVKAGATAGTKMLGKLTAKNGAKTIAKAVTKKALKEGAKKTTKKLSKEGIKKFAKNRAAEVAADMPLDIAHSYKDSKGDAEELVKNMGLNVAMNVGVGGGAEYLGKGVKALKNKAVAKSAMKKATKNRKETAKAVKGALESLENRAKEQGDYLSDLRTKMGVKTKTAPKQKPVKGKTVKKAKAETELTIENIRTGKKITGRPRNKQEAQMMLRVASRGAKSTDDIRTTTREVGSPQATHRQPTSKSQATVEQPRTSKSQTEVQGKQTELNKLKEQSNEVARDVEELGKKYQNNPAEMMNDPEYGRLMRKHDDIEERINGLSEEVEQPRTSKSQTKGIDNEIKRIEDEQAELQRQYDNGEIDVDDFADRHMELEEQKERVRSGEPETTAGMPRAEGPAKASGGGSSAEPPKNEPPENRTPAEAPKEPKINRDIEHDTPEAKGSTWKRVRSKIVDSGAALEDVARSMIKNGDEATKKRGRDIYGAVNAVRQAPTMAEFHLKGTSKQRAKLKDVVKEYIGTESLGKSASEITTPLRKWCKKLSKDMGLAKEEAWDDFQRYVFHKHNLQRAEQGKSVFGENWTAKDSDNAIKEIEKKYGGENSETMRAIKDYHGEVLNYFKELQDMRVKASLVSKEQRDLMDEVYENYIQTKRSTKAKKNVITNNNNNNTVGVSKMHSAKESNLPILSIEEQMKTATEEVYQRIANNNLIQKLAEAQGGNGDELIKAGMDADEVMEKSLFVEKNSDGSYNMMHFEDGKPVKTPCDPDVAESIKELNKAGINPANIDKWAGRILKGAEVSNSIFKKLVTEWNPFFALYRNPMKDIGDAMLYSKDFVSFMTHMPQAAKHLASRDKYWQLWKASGGTSSSLFESTKSLRISKNPIGMMNQMFEQFPRMTEFSSMIDKQLKAAGHKPGEFQYLTKEMIDNASQAGADITVNFGRSGEWVRNLNKFGVPFLNPGVQGLSKAARTLVTERHGAKAWIGLALKASALGFTPAAVQEIVYKDDKDYQNLNARDKANNILIKQKDGTFAKIPIGRALADISAPARKITSDILGTDGYTMKDIRELIANNSAPANPFEDNLVSPIFRTLRNETWYGGKIQSDWETDNKKPENIYDANTTELSKWFAKTKVGRALKLSPKQLDTLMKSYTGVAGEVTMPMMTQRSAGSPEQGIKRLLEKTFKINPIYSNKLQNQFYEKSEEATKAADGGTKAQKERAKEYDKMSMKRLSKLNDAIDKVEGMNISVEKKNNILDNLTKARNKMLDKFNKSEKVPNDYKYVDMGTVNKYLGANQAIELYESDSNKADAKAYAKNHDLADIINVEKDITKYGFPATRSRQPKIKALAIEENGVGNKDLYNYFNIDKSTQKTIKAYHAAGGNIKELGGVQKNLEKIVKKVYGEKSGKSAKDLPKGALAYALSLASGKNRVYQMYDESKPMSKDYWKHSVLSGQGMVATGLTAQDRQKAYDACKGATGHCSKDAIINYLDKKNWTQEQKSYMFWQLANWNTKENPYGDYTPKFKPKKTKSSGKSGQIDYSTPEAKAFFNKFGANMSKERLELAQKLYKAAKASKKGINAPYSNDKDYLPKETLQVVRSGDKELDAEALKALKNGGLKNIIRKANATLPKAKEPEDSDSIFGDGKEGSSSGGGYYRRYGRGYRRYGRGGGGRGGSGGGTTETGIDEVKATPNKTKTYDWTPKDFESKPGWTDAQIRKVFNALIKQGLTEQQAVSRIASLWNTRFS